MAQLTAEFLQLPGKRAQQVPYCQRI